MGKYVEYFIRIIFYMRAFLFFSFKFMLINTYIYLFNQIFVINYTEFEHFRPKCPVYGGKSSFMGKNVMFFYHIIFHMRTYLLLRLHFMLINTYMDLFNQIYVINYTKFDHFGPKCPVYGEKSSFMGKNVKFFLSYNISHAYIPSYSFAIHAY